MPMITIRPMVEADIPAAITLWQGLPGIRLRDADNPGALAVYLQRNPGCSFIARDDRGELLGVSLAGHDGRRGYLHHAAVRASHQRQGIGRRLVEHCVAALRAQGIDKVQLFVLSSNLAGRDFWKRLGWSERQDVLLMSRVTGDSPNA
jgi:ribosomal protein S18 acetylase RimI-like enzyme